MDTCEQGFTAGGVRDDDNDDNDTVFCGVFDGHGPFGHLAAQRVRDSLPSKLIHFWHEQLAAIKSSKEEAATTTTQEKIPAAKTKQMGDDDERTTTATKGGGDVHEAGTPNGGVHEAVAKTTNGDVHEAAAACNGFTVAETVNKNVIAQKASLQEDSETGIAVFEAWKKPHLAAYKTMDKELQLHPDIDCFCSGTTSVTLLKQVPTKSIFPFSSSLSCLLTVYGLWYTHKGRRRCRFQQNQHIHAHTKVNIDVGFCRIDVVIHTQRLT